MILHNKEKFFEQTCILTAIHFHWLTRNQKQHFSFSKCSRDLFSNTLTDLWAGHSSSKTLQWQEPKKERGEMIILELLKSIWFWQMQDISKHVLFTNSKFNCLRCYFSLSGYSFILLVYTFNFHLLHIKYYTVFSSTNSFSTHHFYHWSSSCIFAMKRLKSCV